MLGGWAAQAAGVTLGYFLAAAFAIPSGEKIRWWFVLLVAPGLLLFGMPIVSSGLRQVAPLLLIPPLASALGIVVSRSSSRTATLRSLSIGLAAVTLAFFAWAGMLNWLAFSFATPVRPFEAPEFSFADDHGRVITNASLRGKVVVLDFWTTSCAICYRKFPEIQRVHDRFRNREDVTVYAVHLLQPSGESDYPTRFFARSNFDFPRLSSKEPRRVMATFGFAGVPTIVIIDRNGRVVYRGSGLLTGHWAVVGNLARTVDRIAG